MKTQAHLIVDGNNALHAVPEVTRILAVDREAAREALLRILCPIHDSEGVRLTVVFDGREGLGSLQKYGPDPTFSIVYSAGDQTADGAIERMLLASRNPSAITVATNDNLIRNCAMDVGAGLLRCEDLPLRADHALRLQQQVTQAVPKNKKLPPFENRIDLSGLIDIKNIFK